MTELCGRSRTDQVNEIIESVEKCEQQLNELMDRLQWSREKLPKAKNPKESDGENDEATKTERIDSAPLQLESVDQQRPNESGVDFPDFGDRSKLNVTSYIDLNKLKRDMRRRRMKHRVTKTAPLTYTEEIRELIAIQMEIERNRHQ